MKDNVWLRICQTLSFTRAKILVGRALFGDERLIDGGFTFLRFLLTDPTMLLLKDTLNNNDFILFAKDQGLVEWWPELFKTEMKDQLAPILQIERVDNNKFLAFVRVLCLWGEKQDK